MSHNIIYLLDDEAGMLDLLADVVELAGLRARGYTCARRFFEEVTAFESGTILVLDLLMPGMDGIEVMRRLAEMDQAPALILISGHDIGVLHAAEKLGRAQKLEILDSLAKPVSLGLFRSILEKYAGNDTSEDQSESRAAIRKPGAAQLRQAIHDGQLVLHYQPQVEMKTGTLAGVEALVRWQHPDQGLIYPGGFIPLAEQKGLMGELSHWVVGEVVRQEQLWRESGLLISVSANISAENIASLTLPEYLSQLLADNQLDPTRLTLEVTESALMGELVTSLDILTRLRLKGMGLSIDDFGTGYSSLSQLHRIPFTELKIDLGFVSNMTADTEARAIVKTCILLGHELNMKVVAEGVEDQHTWDLLTGLGCDVAQGYFIAKPMPAAEVLKWIRSH